MPNRIIKESICVSDNLDKLTWFEECLFYRLIVNCDDFGRFDGRTAVIKNRLFPLKDNVTAASVEKALKALVNAELVAMYVYDGKPYLHLLTWGNHQTVRNKKSKYPAPEDGVHADDCNLQAIECNCLQLNANVPVIQSESNPNPNPNTNPKGARAPFTAPDSEGECKESIYAAVISYLNERAGTKFNPSSKKTQDLIRSRVKEGFTLEDFKSVIDKKCADWLRDAKMREFLRPSTLFGGRFEEYLNSNSGKGAEANGASQRNDIRAVAEQIATYL